MIRFGLMLYVAGQRFFDVAIVGGGPAGLAAAVYLARFLRSTVVFDAGDARAKLIPKTRNCPGFPEGISGKELLERLREQAGAHRASIVEGRVQGIERCASSFMLATTSGVVEASFLILATGIVDKAPAIGGLHEAIAAGTIRLCPICDAYEAIGRRIGVAGPEQSAFQEALFLRDYSPHVVMLFNYPDQVSDETRREAAAAGIEIWDSVDDMVPQNVRCDVIMADCPQPREIDVLYLSTGCDVRSELATNLGADCDEEGYVLVGSHLETSVRGLYAIGDVTKKLNQIAVGFGHAALAATHIHNALHARKLARSAR